MEQDSKKQVIIDWLKIVDKPLKTKEGDKKGTGRAMNEAEQKNK